ncbi:DUF6493 family protein [Actinorugispora endophytica]|uniref:HEAT repeat protein n=1 Tax=Actinorugispora endophytica TaxID=1605990 RepID=A0A4R6V2Q0_9ACTN|nr:DUF6493 family protein [Actinorugispora endophytica]TDQ54454.1 hypothetical protein EV190_102288 [Actinorugispora endophytica]
METTAPTVPGNPPAWSAALPERERTVLEKAGKTLTAQTRAVLSAVAEEKNDRLPGLVAALSEQERRACGRVLKAWLAPMHETSEDYRVRTSEVWQAAERRKEALKVAGAGCATGAADAARWITHRSLSEQCDTSTLLEVLLDRPAEWLADVAHRVVARSGREDWPWGRFPLVEHLILRSGAAVPTDGRFVMAWMRNSMWYDSGFAWTDVLDGKAVLRREGRKWDSFDERLRDDPFLDDLVPLLFEADGAGHLMQRSDRWIPALVGLAGDGRLDRGMLVDGALGRLLRPGRPNELRGFRELLDALAPTEDEYAAHTVTLLRILPDAPSPEAGYAQKILVGLDEAGRLSDEHLADASASVLFRPEKVLVRAQLSWLDRAARRDRSRAGVVVPAAAVAFGHPDPALQERALALVERHLKHAGDAVRADLAAAVEALSPALRPRAAELLGVPDSVPGPEAAAVLPAVPEARPVAPPVTDPAEAAIELNAALAAVRDRWVGYSRDYRVLIDVPVFERVLDGLVRCARADRDALLAELRAVARDHPWREVGDGDDDWDMAGIRCVVAEALGESEGPKTWETRRAAGGYYGTAPLNAVLRERLREVAGMVVGGDGPPFLLAVPTLSDGRIDPAVLVDRIVGYERLGVVPGGVDLSQALLRVDTGAATEGVLADARRLSSEAGAGLAAWLEAGGLPEPKADRANTADCSCGDRHASHLLFAWEQVAAPCALHPVFDDVLDGNRYPQHSLVPYRNNDHWPAALPLDRELVALHLQKPFPEGRAPLLPALAAAHGAAGPVLHMGAANGLGTDHADVRAQAVDAVLVLAARGDLDTELLAGELAGAARRGLDTEGLAESLRALVHSGLHAVVWALLSAALPVLADDVPAELRIVRDMDWTLEKRVTRARGLTGVLEVAAECARLCGAGGEMPQVSALAARKGANRLVKAARTLRTVLAGS